MNLLKNFALIAAIAATLFTSCDTSHSDDTTLLVGTNAEYPPFTFIKDGEIVGFEIDLAREVCKKMGKKMQLRDMPFTTLIPETIVGNLDFVAAGMSPTEERKKRVLFSKPYLTDDPFVIVTLKEKGSIGTVEELIGKTVVVNDGFTADIFLAGLKGITLQRLPALTDGFLSLQSGRSDAFVTSRNTIMPFISSKKGEPFQFHPIADTDESYAIMVSKKHPEILEQVQKALDALAEDGTIDKLKIKWELS